MLGQVKKVSITGERNDEISHSERPLLESEIRERTDQLLLAAAEIDYQEDVIRQREEGINHIQRDVNQIHNLFQDMAMHVATQGEMLDNIEANVTSARDQTGQANNQLRAANQRAPSARKTAAQFLILALMLVIIILMLKSLLSPGTVADFFGSVTLFPTSTVQT